MGCINGSGNINGLSGSGRFTEVNANVKIPFCYPASIKNSDSTYIIDANSGEFFTLPDIDITNSEGTLLDTIPSVKDYEAPDATIKNSTGTILASAPSGADTTLEDKILYDSAGNILAVIPAGTDATAPDAQVKNSDNTYTANILPGAILNLPNINITNSLGNFIKYGHPAVKDYEVPDTIAKNSEGTILKSIPSGFDDQIPNIQFTDTFGNVISKPAGINITATQVIKTYAWPVSSGQATSYQTGDDAWVFSNIFSNLPGGKTPRLIDFYNLRNESNNANSFGHYKRFTGSTGGYYDEVAAAYKTVAGVTTTRALAFPDDYLIDHYTGLGWLMVVITGATLWAQVVSGGLGTSFGGTRNTIGFTNWFAASLSLYNTIRNMSSGATGNIGYSPFALSSTYATTTSAPSAPTTQFMSVSTSGQISTASKSISGGPYLICRKHF